YHKHDHNHDHGLNDSYIQAHHRSYTDIVKMISTGNLSERAIENAIKVFRVLAEAEAKVHASTINEVHFHEVGAVDSLVDIVGSVVALDLLEVDEVLVSILPWSRGFVNCAHGILPLPAPATLEILPGFKFKESGITGELITPTGASLLRALAKQSEFPQMTLERVGYGAGKNNYGIPNMLRAVLGQR
ncbi:MAG: LarC family nickel insertion protein, partial [Desulfitobacterium hafniense]|nr:LarC family nickel insertion protein [Desulfitobacterium hafniense]